MYACIWGCRGGTRARGQNLIEGKEKGLNRRERLKSTEIKTHGPSIELENWNRSLSTANPDI